MSDRLEQLKGNHLFRGLDPELTGRIAALAQFVELEEGAIIFEAGDTADGVYLIVEGSVRITAPAPDDRQLTLGLVGEGDFLGEIAVLDITERSARATVAMKSTLGHLRTEQLNELFDLAPIQIARNLARGAIRRIRSMNERHLEETLRAERLSLVGQTAGRIVHDLKNPIGRVLNVADFLEGNIGGLSPEKMAGMLRRSADQMLGMVQDILDFSRGDRRISLEPTTIKDVFQDVREEMGEFLEQRSVELKEHRKYDGTVAADRRVLVRGLVNIVKNAGEAMEGGGTLTVRSELIDGSVAITIADTGGGIPDSILPQIFEPFKTYGKSNGTGLGMAITKSAVDAHGGKIKVDSVSGEGTTFTVTIPLSRRAQTGTDTRP